MPARKLVRGDVVLQGANADLWEIAERHAPQLVGTPRDADMLAAALGANQDNVRVDKSKRIISALWQAHASLGPYPFLETLSQFEFDRVFYPQYRDHVCHQLKVYLLGLGIYHGCPRVRDAVATQLGSDNAFELAWMVTAVFHDVGYVVEATHGGPGEAMWNRVTAEYANTMKAPLAATALFPRLTKANEVARRVGKVPDPQLGYQIGHLAADELFEFFKAEADAAGLRADDSAQPTIQSYWEFAQKTASSRAPFRDHGVASALMLMRHWTVMDDYIASWLPHARSASDAAGKGRPPFTREQLSELSAKRAEISHLVQRAAGAMSIHNVTPSMWSGVLSEAAAAGLDFERFRIALGKDTPRANGLAFLLGLVDTLQDWDRPTFGETPRPDALLGDDLRVRIYEGRIGVHVVSDHEEFRSPATSRRSRYASMVRVLKEYLDEADVEALVTWTEEPADDRSPSFAKTLAKLLEILKEISPPLRDEQVARVVESAMSLFRASPIVDAAVSLTNECLPTCYSINALDVLGPEAWASPTAFQYLAAQLRHYARANVDNGKWSLRVSKKLGTAIHRAIENAKRCGMSESITLFDNPPDFNFEIVDDRPPLEYARILLWTEEELSSPIAKIVIDTHLTFHVPLFFLEAERGAPERQFDFICFRCATPTSEWQQGAANKRTKDGSFEFVTLKNGRLGNVRVNSYYDGLLEREELMFAVDARDRLLQGA